LHGIALVQYQVNHNALLLYLRRHSLVCHSNAKNARRMSANENKREQPTRLMGGRAAALNVHLELRRATETHTDSIKTSGHHWLRRVSWVTGVSRELHSLA